MGSHSNLLEYIVVRSVVLLGLGSVGSTAVGCTGCLEKVDCLGLSLVNIDRFEGAGLLDGRTDYCWRYDCFH